MSEDSVIMPSRPDELVRRVGRELLQRGLLDGRSLFAPDRAVWTAETTAELYRLYNQQPDAGTDLFLVKLRRQLDTASDEAIQLAAELLTLQGLPLVNLTAVTLRKRINEVLGWMRHPVTIPEQVLAAFSQGTWSGGIGAHTMLWIRDAFSDPATPPSGELNRDLFAITVRIQRETGKPVDFYRQKSLAQIWRKPEPATGERRAWLVRPRQGGADLVRRWQAESFVSLAASHLGEMSPGTTRAGVRAAVEAGYQHLDYAQRMNLATEFHAFLSRMAGGDIVVTQVGDYLYAGVIDGEAGYRAGDGETALRRPASWLTHDPIVIETLPAPLPAELDQQGSVVDLTGALEVLTALIGEEDDTVTAPGAVVRTTPALAAATPELADRLHIDQPWLQDLIEVWQDRSQIVLYGPPGTGKTYLARALAAHVADRDAVRLVQFHPSYAYEDFFEGFRPIEATDTGTVGFAKTPGPLREIAAEAKENPEQPYVLIIDEINRANLAKVFGELYFLLEYREATVRLQYSPSEAFNLPPNVFIIGTMNTADRSIALVDAAIRRRFAFVELHPEEPPVREVLGKWLAANGLGSDERAALLAALNNAIDDEQDHDFKIGPSYLMRPDLSNEGALERVWRYDLMPLLEEHYYGRHR